jgi:hypothetical protein
VIDPRFPDSARRGSVNVRFAPKATAARRRRGATQWANIELMHRNMIGTKKDRQRGGLCGPTTQPSKRRLRGSRRLSTQQSSLLI